MRKVVPIVLLCLLIPLHLFDLRRATDAWKNLPQGDETTFVIPGKILRLSSLEFDGLIADFMFLRSLVFYGKMMERNEQPKVKPWEWRRIYDELSAATDLDPYFYDPYKFGQGILTWDGGMVAESNVLLEKGSSYRTWDWTLPFYIGFNHFYFMHEDAVASKYLMESSRIPGAPRILPSLATRLAIKGKQTENAITFLLQLVAAEKDEARREEYELRLEALKSILLLEQAVALYVQRYGNQPLYIEDLVDKNLIHDIPLDPYGGEFYITNDGLIKTTSDLHKQ